MIVLELAFFSAVYLHSSLQAVDKVERNLKYIYIYTKIDRVFMIETKSYTVLDTSQEVLRESLSEINSIMCPPLNSISMNIQAQTSLVCFA